MQWSKLFKSVWIPTFGGLEKSRVTRFRDEHVIWLTNLHSPLSYNSEYSTCQEETNLLDLVRRTSGKARAFCDTLSGSGIWGIQFSNKPFVTSGFIKFPMWTWWKEYTPKVRTTMLLPFDGLFLQYKNKCTPEAQIQSQTSCGQNRCVCLQIRYTPIPFFDVENAMRNYWILGFHFFWNSPRKFPLLLAKCAMIQLGPRLFLSRWNRAA